jgi:hypothetical protein
VPRRTNLISFTFGFPRLRAVDRWLLAVAGKLGLNDAPHDKIIHLGIGVDENVAEGNDATMFADSRGQGSIKLRKFRQRLAMIVSPRSTARRSMGSRWYSENVLPAVNFASNSAACWMSYRHFLASSRIEQGLVAFNTLAEVRVPDGRGNNQVHPTLEELLQGLNQAKVGLSVDARRELLELHQEVKIAMLGVEIVTQCRAEELQAPHVVLAAKLSHFVPFLFNQPFHPEHPLDTEYQPRR